MMRRDLLLLVCSVLVMISPPAGSAASPPTIEPPSFAGQTAYKVLSITDGDTLTVMGAGGVFKVRLIGVDTPETVHPTKPVQQYGKEASRFTTNLLAGEKVYLLGDGASLTKDRYGRVLAYAYRAPDGLFVNAEIVRQGYGHAYVKYPFKHLEQFRQLEAFARSAKKGLWTPGDKPPVATTPPTPATPSIRTRPDRVPVAPPRIVPPKSAPPRIPSAGPVTVYVTKTGSKYHRGGCRYLRKSSIPMSLENAKQRYSPCSVCGPPR